MTKNEALKMMQEIGINKFSYGVRLRYLREYRNMTQKQLGIMCGFNPDTADVRIRQYESGQKIPKNEIKIKIDKALGITGNILQNYGDSEGVQPDSDFLSIIIWAMLFDIISITDSGFVPNHKFLTDKMSAINEKIHKMQNEDINYNDYIDWLINII